MKLARHGGTGLLSRIAHRVRVFKNIVVHPTQELRGAANTFRGGPAWPHFQRQILVRHCRGRFPRPVDYRPHPAEPEWPYFDPDRYLDPRYKPLYRWRLLPDFADDRDRRAPERWLDEAGAGFWCGAITDHFGHMVAEFGARIAASSRLDAAAPLVFSIQPLAGAAAPAFFWQMIDHLGIDRRRVMLVRKPTRFGRLSVVPQAERPYGGPANRRHLRLMDAINAAASPRPEERADLCIFVSRSRLPKGNFAGESYLDGVLAAAGVTVLHPETVDLHTQLRLYRRARRLVFSEGSAMLALQLLGHLDADIVVLPRRPGDIERNIATVDPLRARARGFCCLPVLHGTIQGLQADGRPHAAHGISVLDEQRLVASFASLGIALAPLWDRQSYLRQRDADIAGWVERRLAASTHPDERQHLDACLAALSLCL